MFHIERPRSVSFSRILWKLTRYLMLLSTPDWFSCWISSPEDVLLAPGKVAPLVQPPEPRRRLGLMKLILGATKSAGLNRPRVMQDEHLCRGPGCRKKSCKTLGSARSDLNFAGQASGWPMSTAYWPLEVPYRVARVIYLYN